MSTRSIKLAGEAQRKFAIQAILAAPVGSVVSVAEPNRTKDQNGKMWAMLEDIRRAKPRGLDYTKDDWKAAVMRACHHEVRMIEGLDGEQFPAGFRSSQLSVAEMGQLIEFMYWMGSEFGIEWRETERAGWAE